MEPNTNIITYEPRRIIDYILEKGHITSPDLQCQFEYDEMSADHILYSMSLMGVLTDRDSDYVFSDNAVHKVHYLTEEGKDVTKWPERIQVALEEIPVFPKVQIESANDLLAILRAKGMTIEEGKAAMESGDFGDLLQKIRTQIIGDLSPDQLRQYGKDLEGFVE